MSTQPGRHEKEQNMRNWNRTKKAIAAAALVATGFGGGAAVMLTGAASAETTASTNRSDEEALTGDALDQVTAAVEAEYPGATIERAETDSDGVYEAHITTADGDELTVELDDSYAITGAESR
jgi:ABC-type glycerol-3-phosphate transport system substrate-binding protein